ncbi:acyltransferase [Palleniella muris]|uniref:Acyltransferase n=1 Tax=Palleniella muris TaxID=3038145 RepID=A0AC61QQL2_9BACT|nr:acyltransferase [Palleniella muris]TGX82354.1 acyltransferase [Palleniella muris]
MNNKNLAIEALRLPLIILVVFIHENPTFDSLGYWGLTVNTIAQVAVPCFFLIAGYFFIGRGPLTWEIYKAKLSKRARTLLVPYLLWNLVPSLVLIGGNLFSILFRGKSPDDLLAFLSGLWNEGLWHLWWDKVNGMPSDSPLWFLRDLIVMCLMAPVFYYFIRKCGTLMVAVLFLLYVFLPGDLKSIPGVSLTAIFFFNVGMYLRYNGISLIDRDRKYQASVVAITFLLLLMVVVPRHQGFLCPLFIAAGTYSSFALIGRANESVVTFMSRFSPTIFFIYAVHQTFVLAQTGKIVARLLPDSYAGHVLAYLIVPFVTTAVCMAIYYVLRLISPKLIGILCGGR